MTLADGFLILNTVRYWKPVQIYGPLLPQRRTAHGETPSLRQRTGSWTPAIERETTQTGPNRFRLLNEEREIASWNDAGIPKLWLNNLHYLQYPTEELISRWILENPPVSGVGWEPYPLSLRIVYWVKWALAGHRLSEDAIRSLAQQARVLSQSIEYHIQANHLLENYTALVFAGAFFQGPEADRWLRTGLEGLAEQVPEQILNDGGHYERSPMYHSLVLEDLLDLINLHSIYPLPEPRWDQNVVTGMLAWLDNLCHPDGEISFFNDAAFSVAPRPARIKDYAASLGIQSNGTGLGESGYVRLENNDAVVLFDAGSIGPDYQPAHAHADTLSFELSIRGQRALVNSGTSTYEDNALRQQQRGTAAHNTVVVDYQNQSEVWGAFHVARRAKPQGVQSDHRSYAEASHNGYLRLAKPVTHHRRVELRRDSLIVEDSLTGTGNHSFDAYFHLHPEADVDLQLDPRLVRTDAATFWYPQFNTRVSNRTAVASYAGATPLRFQTRIPWK